MFVTIISLIIGVLGFVATLVGTYLTYISYINPVHKRFQKYLNKPGDWERVFKDQHLTVFRHKDHLGFQITINWNETIVSDYRETWIRRYPDQEHNNSYLVAMEANGIFIGKELFVSLDGGRGFVPVPRIRMEGEERKFYYDSLQVKLARIVAKYPLERSLEEFAASQAIPIEMPS